MKKYFGKRKGVPSVLSVANIYMDIYIYIYIYIYIHDDKIRIQRVLPCHAGVPTHQHIFDNNGPTGGLETDGNEVASAK